MKTLVINPNSDESMTKSIRNLVDNFNPQYIKIDVVGMKNTPKLLNSKESIEKTYEETLRTIKNFEEEYDIFILACHLDPNLDKLRENTKKIIIGICESSLLYSQTLGKRFSIIGSSAKTVNLKKELVQKYGVDNSLDYIGYPDENVDGEIKDKLLSASKSAKSQYKSDAIVLGCAGFVGIDSFIENELKIEVIDGIYTALIIADGYAKYHNYKNKN